jgi:hypothetical protein
MHSWSKFTNRVPPPLPPDFAKQRGRHSNSLLNEGLEGKPNTCGPGSKHKIIDKQRTRKVSLAFGHCNQNGETHTRVKCLQTPINIQSNHFRPCERVIPPPPPPRTFDSNSHHHKLIDKNLQLEWPVGCINAQFEPHPTQKHGHREQRKVYSYGTEMQ